MALSGVLACPQTRPGSGVGARTSSLIARFCTERQAALTIAVGGASLVAKTPAKARPAAEPIDLRSGKLFLEALDRVHKRADHGFAWLMAIQWVVGVAVFMARSAHASADVVLVTRVHVCQALLVGAALGAPMIFLAVYCSGRGITRHAAAIMQMLWSAVVIHVAGGRVATDFYLFGSLVFLAFYRDWTVLLTATLVVVGDHLFFGLSSGTAIVGGASHAWWHLLERPVWVALANVVLVVAVLQNLEEMRRLAGRQAEMEHFTERTQELIASWEQYRALVETTRAVPWHWEVNGQCFTYVGPQCTRLLGCAADEWMKPGFLSARLHPEDHAQVLERWTGGTDFEFRMKRNDGQWVWVRNVAGDPVDDSDSLHGLLLDVTERHQMEFELQQAQKLESVGRLASGVAHEINTPIQFVNDSLEFLRDGLKDLLPLLGKYRKLRETAGGRIAPEAVAEIEQAEIDADLDFLLENLPKAIERSADGLSRVANIVRAMKDFAHPDAKEKSYSDINRGVATTLTIASNEYKYVANVQTELSELPPVLCHLSELNQVFLNLIVNAAHAIGDVVKGTDRKGLIKVTTRQDGQEVVVSISDTGSGIPNEIRQKIFDPFFTTKEVGRGTGQGLAIARNVVVEKHGGTITVESEVGRGSTFVLRLPIAAQEVKSRASAAA
jgi:PAS domain S-box-containing protein